MPCLVRTQKLRKQTLCLVCRRRGRGRRGCAAGRPRRRRAAEQASGAGAVASSAACGRACSPCTGSQAARQLAVHRQPGSQTARRAQAASGTRACRGLAERREPACSWCGRAARDGERKSAASRSRREAQTLWGTIGGRDQALTRPIRELDATRPAPTLVNAACQQCVTPPNLPHTFPPV